MKRTGVIIATLAALAGCHAGDEQNPKGQDHACRDAAEWAQWDALLSKTPNDADVVTLYALRRGLCDMIERGQIEPKAAIALFERAHQAAIGRAIDEAATRKRAAEL